MGPHIGRCLILLGCGKDQIGERSPLSSLWADGQGQEASHIFLKIWEERSFPPWIIESSLDYHPCETNSSSQLKIGGHKEDSFCEGFLVPGIRAVFVSGSPGTVHRVDLRGPGSGRVRFGTWRNIVVGARKTIPKRAAGCWASFFRYWQRLLRGSQKTRR